LPQGRRRFRAREVRLRPARAPAVILMLLVCGSAGYSRTFLVRENQLPFLNLVQQPNAEIRMLEVGTPIKREADGNAVHLYRVLVVAGQYFRGVVDQQGVDVKVTLFGPDGHQVMQADGPSGANGPEPISVIAESTGEYRIEVRLPEKKPPAGSYVINLEALRSPTQTDKDRVSAEKLFWEGYQLFKQPTVEARRKALEKYQQALPMFRALNDHSLEFYSSLLVGFIYRALGELQSALDYYGRALRLCKDLGNKTDEPILLNNIGNVYDALGEPQKALAYYGEALALWSARVERGPEADTLNNVGLIHFNLGEPQQALDYYDRSLALKRELGNAAKTANTISNIAVVYATLGEEGRALEYLKEALSLQRQAKDISGEATTHYFTAYVYGLLGDMTKALEAYNQALPLQRTVGNRRGEGITLDSMGVVFNSMGQRQKALEYHQQALDLQKATKDRRSEAATLEHIGYVHALSGELERATQDYNEALSLSQAVGDRREEANVLQGMARVECERGDLPAARKRVEEAISKIEAVRGQTDTQLRASYLGVKHGAYEFYIDLLMQMHRLNLSAGDDATALRISEQAHARSLLEILSEGQANIRQGVDAALLERERSLSQQVNAKAERLMQALGQDSKERAAVLNQEISKLEDQYQQAQAAIRRSSPAYAALTQPQPLGLKEIQQQLDQGTMLLEYSLGEERSYVWAVTGNSCKAYELPRREQIETAARQVYTLLTARSQLRADETSQQKQERIAQTDSQLFKATTELSQMVLGPIGLEKWTQRLVVVADGALQYVPFSALSVVSGQSSIAQRSRASNGLRTTDNGPLINYRPLIQDYEIISIPSASALAVQRQGLANRKPAPNMVAVIADPVFSAGDERLGALAKTGAAKQVMDGSANTRIIEHLADNSGLEIRRLKFTRQEADQILAEAPRGKNLRAIDFKANRATAIGGELSKYRYVHFATHGYLDSERPDLSAIVLSLVDEEGRAQDGFLRAHEIYNLNLPAELVVLSACETGLGREVKGEGLVGLTRGFMYAGARRVVVSLWNVNDKATAELMARFYRGMLRENKTPAAALRAAQMEMWRQTQWRSPYYWAAFVLQGEWK
jgi:CHAT domain-containing protein/tetratricopeptide (TPR) repeat protein